MAKVHTRTHIDDEVRAILKLQRCFRRVRAKAQLAIARRKSDARAQADLELQSRIARQRKNKSGVKGLSELRKQPLSELRERPLSELRERQLSGAGALEHLLRTPTLRGSSGGGTDQAGLLTEEGAMCRQRSELQARLRETEKRLAEIRLKRLSLTQGKGGARASCSPRIPLSPLSDPPRPMSTSSRPSIAGRPLSASTRLQPLSTDGCALGAGAGNSQEIAAVVCD